MPTSDQTPDQDRYRETVFLPRTTFPMRGGLPTREPETLARWKATDLDGRIAASGAGKPVFTLHDGPPYANGHIHIGHALNKIMKDVIGRAQRMAGHAVRYVPGWDCHGLPIEWRIEEQYRKEGRDKDAVPVLQFRAECRDYAARWLAIQSEEFQRLGVQGDWEHRYATMDFPTEAAIVGEIGRFLLNGGLYRGLRPVMWSPVEKTALAEAEIEYHDMTSTTIHVGFDIIVDPTPGGALQGARAVIWTTTPWTIPANRAIAFGADHTYVVLQADTVADTALIGPGARLLVAEDRLGAFCAEAGITAHRILQAVTGTMLTGAVAAHPLRGQGYDFDVPLLEAGFVTTDAGTGFVHVAPAHGQDDFALGRAHGLPVTELVLDDGRYAETVPLFAGVHVFKAADPVCAALRDAGGLVARSQIVHSYPHSWRSRAPVIFRATPQWFIGMDQPGPGGAGQGGSLRNRALAALETVRFVPEGARSRLSSMVAGRPDWCISRQRAWGVPIAIFVERASGDVLRDPAVMARIVDAVAQHGADIWYSADPATFLGEGRDPADYEQVFDIVDVWFESGSTHAFILGDAPGGEGLNYPADLYLEGSDQHRGWFQSSLLESVGTRGIAPFRNLVTHGFVLDEQGRKMSKSLGNTVAPEDVVRQYGADILRLWIVNSDTTEDLRIGPDILKQQGELYRRLRNTLRWLLGALDGFAEEERVPHADLPPLERYILQRVAELAAMVANAVRTHQWVGVYPALHGFCTNELSAFYFDVRKDALYCDAPSSHRRRSARTVLDILHRALCAWLAPVLVFTAEEAWCARFGAAQSIHLEALPSIPASWSDPELGRIWDAARAVRRLITTEVEALRRAGIIGSSLQARVSLPLSEYEARIFAEIDWAELAIVSTAEIEIMPRCASLYLDEPGAQPREAHGGPVVGEATGAKCARCWRVLDEVGDSAAHPALCLRCVEVVE